MKRIIVVAEIPDEDYEMIVTDLQDMLDKNEISEYETYEENEMYPDIIKRS